MTSLRSPSRFTLVLFGLFMLVSGMVVAGVTLPWDETLLRAIGNTRQPGRTDLMLAFTLAGGGLFSIPMALGIALLLWRLGRGVWATRYILAGVSGELLYALLKLGFHRTRPSLIPRLSDAGWFSYPSGHAMMAPVIWTLGFLLLARAIPHRLAGWILTAIALVTPIAIAFSRVYLGVHYPSDVLGALFLGGAWVIWWWPMSSDARRASTSASPAIS